MKAVTLQTSGENRGHYVPGMIAGGMLYISGQLSLDPVTRKVAEGGIREHMRQALANLDAVLRAAGVTRRDVVQCRVYIAASAAGTTRTTNIGTSSATTSPPASSYPHRSCISAVWSRLEPSPSARRKEQNHDPVPLFVS